MIQETIKIKVFFHDRKCTERGVTGFKSVILTLPKIALSFTDKEKRILVLEQIIYLLGYKAYKACWGCLNNSRCFTPNICPIGLLQSKIIKEETDLNAHN